MSRRVLSTSAPPPLHERVEQIKDCKDFVEFLRHMVADSHLPTNQWENRDLATYLDALARWTASMDGYFRNSGEPVPNEPTWKLMAQMLLAATVYE